MVSDTTQALGMILGGSITLNEILTNDMTGTMYLIIMTDSVKGSQGSGHT